uniref:Forkhead box protein J1-A n=1 Tax=Bactrocera latifrons TaxID=174628 RepID=A0A0K8VB62_BACLA
MPLNNNSNMNESDEEHDLTSLSWLMELRNQNFSWTNDMQQVNLNADEMNNRHNIKWSHEASGGQKDAYDKTSLFKNKDNSNDKINYVFNSDYILPAISNGILLNEFDKQQKEPSSSSDIDKNITKRNCIGKSLEKTCRKSFKGMYFQQQQLKVQIKRATPIERYEIFLEKVKRVLVEYQKSAINYQTDTTEKPPFNYSHIIGMAMLENGRVTLQQICSWIETKFAYFRVRKKWNNSIRHNLSLHQCFRKIDRKKFEKGKGGYWELGVDPRKCDRKRIRNRKSSQHKIRQMQHQHQHQPQKLQKHPLSKNKNKKITQETKTMVVLNRQSPINISYKELQKLKTGSYYSDCGQQQVNEMHTVCPANSTSASSHLLLDELDIQQNIDVVSCCQQSQQEHKIFITSMAEEIPAAINSVPNDNSPKTIELLQNSKLQQYQLGTIIISAPTTKYGSISDFAASTGSINCFINGDYIDDKTHKLQHSFVSYYHRYFTCRYYC